MKREDVIKNIKHMLGFPAIKVELTDEQLNFALDLAIAKYRQRAGASLEESYSFMTLKENQNVYYLPKETQDIRQIFRRGIGGQINSGTTQDPFSMAFTNMYILNAQNSGGLLTYELYSQYLDLSGRYFGRDINFTWHNATKKLTIMRDPKFEEEVLLWVYLETPESVLLEDTQSSKWLFDWSLAESKMMLGEIRSKFSSIIGPQGGTSLNGAELKSEGKEEKERLLEDLKNYVDGSRPLGFIVG